MKLFEYQAKEVFRSHGIPVPPSVLVETVPEVQKVLGEIGLPCVLKSQVLRGGRGKAGLIPFVRTEEQAVTEAQRLLGSEQVPMLLVESAVDIDREIYLSVTVDPVAATALIIASAAGGVEIETLAQTDPEKIVQEPVDITIGLMPYQVNDLVYRLGLNGDVAKQTKKVITNLYAIFEAYDAELVEINPLFVSKQAEVIAGDGKLIIDENSMHRQKGYERTRAYYDSDMEFEAAQEGIPYLQFDGDISLMCAGAGLTTTVYDLVNYEGGSVANYLEFGGPNYRKAVRAMELCLQNESKVILMVTFGTIARADVMAEGIVDAINRLHPDRPIVTCIRGTNEEEAVRILRAAGLEPLFDTEEAVRKAVAIAKGAC
ncbi:MAG: acetate--CoA ligase family protein [Spirochaetia bacterium]|nr:acetate--CoA ligase family protein [Spirochaetia bacterium]MCF7940907.1 acetate--CoA ligase family protein [Spirochaetia bacterium]